MVHKNIRHSIPSDSIQFKLRINIQKMLIGISPELRFFVPYDFLSGKRDGWWLINPLHTVLESCII